MINPIISIIIPCYNGSKFIIETLNSILIQSENRFEVIIIDDGSTDDTKHKIACFLDERIKYIYQDNQGVSVARNNGLLISNGIYVVFFDADDLMTDDFLSSRLSCLESQTHLDFISGKVNKFNEEILNQQNYRGTSNNALEEILLYNSDVITCPSNYIFKKDFLLKNDIFFNPKLFSTADKYFLIQCASFGSSNYFNSLAPLKYRVNINSMSHKLSLNLILDNEQYYKELINAELIPKNLRSKSFFLRDFILFGSYWKLNYKLNSLPFAIKSFLRNPLLFLLKITS